MTPIRLLIADDDRAFRTLTAGLALEAGGGVPLAVHEADDGAEATRIALHRRLHVALLDVNMPRLDGIEAAIALRDVLPQLRVALYTADPRAHHGRARALRLPLFDKLELDDAVDWVTAQVRACASSEPQQRQGLECSACGYGIARAVGPPSCPMCRAEGTWVEARPPAADRRAVV